MEWYKNSIGKLPWWGQVLFFLFLLWLIYTGYKKYKQWRESGNYQAAVSQSQTAIQQLSSQGINPSYAQAQYTSWANTLQGAFQGCSGAGDAKNFWATLEPIFKGMKNDADVYALIKAYGVRTVDKCGLLTGDFEGDLSGTLSEKFSGLEGTIIRYNIEDVNKILKQNGLTFTF